MKIYRLVLLGVFVAIGSCAGLAQTGPIAAAQEPPSAEEDAAALRVKLAEVQEKEDELQSRLALLKEDLKPENIERSLAGIGSTRPEELRELRRRQLENQKTSIETQLQQLAISRARLEAAIASANALAYQESAKGYPLEQLNQIGVLPSRTALGGILLAAMVSALAIVLFVLARRMSRNNI